MNVQVVDALILRMPPGDCWWYDHQALCCMRAPDTGCDPTCADCSPYMIQRHNERKR